MRKLEILTQVTSNRDESQMTTAFVPGKAAIYLTRYCFMRLMQYSITKVKILTVLDASWRECAGVPLRTFFPRSEVQALQAQGVYVPPLDDGELGYVVGLIGSNRSPGFDGLNGEMCKTLWKFISEYLQAIYNKCVWEGYFARERRSARVVPLLKFHYKIMSDTRSYRCISLLPVVGKVVGRVMVEWFQEITQSMWYGKNGFRKGRSIEDA